MLLLCDFAMADPDHWQSQPSLRAGDPALCPVTTPHRERGTKPLPFDVALLRTQLYELEKGNSSSTLMPMRYASAREHLGQLTQLAHGQSSTACRVPPGDRLARVDRRTSSASATVVLGPTRDELSWPARPA
jgi:hypothetical protein